MTCENIEGAYGIKPVEEDTRCPYQKVYDPMFYECETCGGALDGCVKNEN